MEGVAIHTTDVVFDSILALAETALQQSAVYDLRGLNVKHRNGRLVISGTVSRFYHKQLAQELVRGISGEIDVINVVRVLNPPR